MLRKTQQNKVEFFLLRIYIHIYICIYEPAYLSCWWIYLYSTYTNTNWLHMDSCWNQIFIQHIYGNSVACVMTLSVASLLFFFVGFCEGHTLDIKYYNIGRRGRICYIMYSCYTSRCLFWSTMNLSK